MAATPSPTVDWLVTQGLTGYAEALAEMDRRVAAISAKREAELVWLLEHPPLYTAGPGASPDELLEPHRFPVHATGRGGRHTYHGPGQRVIYVMLDVRRRFASDVGAFVRALERWIITALSDLGVAAHPRAGLTGVWTGLPGHGEGTAKIAAIGVRIRSGISLHGMSLNVEPDLEHFAGIIPCGLRNEQVTSLAALGVSCDMPRVDHALRSAFEEVMHAPTRLMASLASEADVAESQSRT